MKILLVCAGGMSTGLLMKNMETYWAEQNEELVINAVGMNEYDPAYKEYDIVLVGPQISYRLNQIKEDTGLPCEMIPALDYAIANCPNIMKLAKKMYAQK